MRTGTRSAAMLVGFLAVAWLQVVAVLLFVLLVLDALPGTLAVQLAVPLVIATAGVLWWATVRALRLPRPAPAGVPVSRHDAPRLWALLDAAAAAAGVAAPDGVTVVAGAGATLVERLRLGGLLGGRRELYLGLPLLQAWDEARLRAAVVHELAHGSPALGGRFAPMAHRGRVALSRIVPRIPARSPAGPVLRAWARWYRAVDDPYSREQELAADRLAASFAGPRAAAAALRDGPVLDGMQQLFHAEYLSPGWQTGHVPDDVFGGFLRVLAARADDAAALRALEPEPPAAWDPHPPLGERLAALAALAGAGTSGPAGPAGDEAGGAPAGDGGPSASLPAVTPPAVPPLSTAPSATEPSASERSVSEPSVSEQVVVEPARAASAETAAPARSGSASADRPGAEEAPSAPAGDLVPDLPGLGRALQAVAFPVGGRTVVGWDDFFGVARIAEMEREADASLRALSRAAGTPVTGPAELLDLAADGRLRKIAETVFGDLPGEEVAGRVTDLIALLLALAALHGGVARWRHSWTGTAELVAIDGSHLDLVGPAELAGDPATVGEARARIAALGIDLAAAAGPGHRPTARVPVLGGVVNVLVDGARTDVLVVETGFVLMPGLPRSRHAEAKRRLTRLATDGVLAYGSPAVPHQATAPAAESGPPYEEGSAGLPAGEAGADSGNASALPAGEAVAAAADSTPGRAGTATLPPAPAGDTPGRRFVPFADVATAAAGRSGRRGWEISLRDGGTLHVRTALDSEELPGGWAALDDAVAFLARTR